VMIHLRRVGGIEFQGTKIESDSLVTDESSEVFVRIKSQGSCKVLRSLILLHCLILLLFLSGSGGRIFFRRFFLETIVCDIQELGGRGRDEEISLGKGTFIVSWTSSRSTTRCSREYLSGFQARRRVLTGSIRSLSGSSEKGLGGGGSAHRPNKKYKRFYAVHQERYRCVQCPLTRA
jgi:hypothetical protein